MIHLAYDNVEEFIKKQKKYAKLSTKEKSLLRSLIAPCWTFINLYIFKLGFLDGRHGFLISKIYALYTFWKYSK
jgi:(heptosyl)LPS beta-1,4-glucosyltransferase